MAVVRITKPKGLLLTGEVLRQCYGFLHATEPFCHWGLPDKHDVVFKVMRKRDTQGDHSYDKIRNVHTIRISSRCIGTTTRLCNVMGHEMIHVAEIGLKTVTRGAHNRAFFRMSDEVCEVHGYDRLDFAGVE